MASTVNNAPSQTQLDAFKKMLGNTMGSKEGEELPFKKVAHVFHIIHGSQDFSFDDADERLGNLLVLSACIYAIVKNKKVCFISPTYWYMAQAVQMSEKYLALLKGVAQKNSSSPVPPGEPSVPLTDLTDKAVVGVTVPGLGNYDELVRESDVVFMHGKDFSEHLPEGWAGRRIIQIFPGEDIPVNPDKPSRLTYSE